MRIETWMEEQLTDERRYKMEVLFFSIMWCWIGAFLIYCAYLMPVFTPIAGAWVLISLLLVVTAYVRKGL